MAQNTATATDADLILKLYDLRRETLMRQARDSVANFWPQSAQECIRVAQDFGGEQNAYFRQVVSYWEMAAGFVLKGALNEELFLDSAGEMVFVFAKFHPFLPELRKAMNAPEFYSRVEQLLERSEKGRQMLKATIDRLKMFAEMRAKAAKK